MDRDERSALPSLTLRISTVVSYVLLILVNAASNSGMFGVTNAQISELFPTPLTPAGWAFSIWGLIFGLQGVGAVYQALPAGYQDAWKKRIVNSIGYTWQLGWYCEMAWQLCFLLETPLGMLLSLGFLLGAFLAFALALYRLYGLKDQYGSLSNVLLYMAFFLPTTLNTAWLSVASSVGALIVPVAYGVTADLEVAACVLAAIVTALGVLVVQKERDSMYSLTLVWALVAVYGKQSNPAVRIASLVCVSVCCVMAIFSMLRRRTGNSPEPGELRQPLKVKTSDNLV